MTMADSHGEIVLRSRLPYHLIVRLLIIAVTIALAVSAAILSVVQVTRVNAPDVTLSIFPNEPMALVAKIDLEPFQALTDPARLRAVKVAATRSAVAQALNPSALRMLAFSQVKHGRVQAARQLALVANKVSRRELGAHVFLIEDYVARDDVKGALRHYDLALRSSSGSRAILTPVLIRAMEDEQINATLSQYIRKQPDWLYPFLQQAVVESRDPSTVARLVERSGGWPSATVFQNLQSVLLTELAAKGQYESVKRHYLSSKNGDPKLLFSPAITEKSVSKQQGALAWQSIGSAVSGFEVVAEARHPVALLFFAGSGARETVSRKLLFVSPGTHRLSVEFGRVVLSSGSGFKWSATCLGVNAGGKIWQSEILRPNAEDRFTATINVPKNCHTQALDVEMIGGDGQTGTEVVVKSVTLSNVSGGG
jgi:hypothetical protein